MHKIYWANVLLNSYLFLIQIQNQIKFKFPIILFVYVFYSQFPDVGPFGPAQLEPAQQLLLSTPPISQGWLTSMQASAVVVGPVVVVTSAVVDVVTVDVVVAAVVLHTLGDVVVSHTEVAVLQYPA